MKRIIVVSLLVLLTICLFVGCSSSPKEEEKKIITLKIYYEYNYYYGDVELDVSGCETFGDIKEKYPNLKFDVTIDTETITDFSPLNGEGSVFQFSNGKHYILLFNEVDGELTDIFLSTNKCDQNTKIENNIYYCNFE